MKSIFSNGPIALGILLSLLSISATRGQSVIGVNPFANTGDFVGINYSGGSNPGLDETFAVPANDPILNSINLYTTTVTNAEAGLNASLYQWSPTNNTPVGSALWSSATPQTIAASNDLIPVLLTFTTGGVRLNSTDEYLLEFTAYNSALVTGTPAIGIVSPATYSNGFFVAFGSNTYYPKTSSNLDFTASFTPEPSTWALLLGGLGLLAFWQRRKLNA